MTLTTHDAIFYLNQATNLEEISLIFERILQEYGFDLFAVQYTTPEVRRLNSEPFYLTNFPEPWVEHYYSSRYDKIDPVILEGKQRKTPYVWHEMWEGVTQTGQQKEFFHESNEYGGSSGVGLPIQMVNNEPGIVSFVASGKS